MALDLGNSPRRGRILVVDDSPASLAALCELLVENHDVLFATTGPEALEVAYTQEPDLILLDVVMPGMDGYETCVQLKASPRTADIPVLFITCMGEEPDQARGLAAGAIDYIQKPISPPLVRARVQNQLELKRRQDALRGLIVKDGLTGISNRRHFDETLREEWMRGVRNQKPLSLLMIDLDHFKQYNDAYGHAAGDACLREVAAVMHKNLQRPVDLLARFGGDEFACLLPETDTSGALRVAERFQDGVARLESLLKHSQASPPITLSQGLATILPVAEGHPESLLLEADSQLYEAKRRGRNRIVHPGGTQGPAPSSVDGPRDPARPTVLLVEDDKHMRTLLAARLEFLGATTESVSSAPEALSFLARRKAHLILSDVVMPGIDGFTLCQRLKEDPVRRRIPFVLLTSLSRNLRERSAQAGADDHLSKLEDESIFRMRIRFLLELGTLLEGTAGADASAEGASVVLLSPSATVRTQMKVHLKSTGILVRDQDNAEGALQDIAEDPPDLVALDLEGEDPGVFLLRLRELPGGETIPVLVLAHKGEDALLPSLESRIQDRLPKPLEAQEVRHRISLLLRLVRARRGTGMKVQDRAGA